MRRCITVSLNKKSSQPVLLSADCFYIKYGTSDLILAVTGEIILKIFILRLMLLGLEISLIGRSIISALLRCRSVSRT